MALPIEITFQGMDTSEAIEARIREKMKRLTAHFDRLTHARVVITSPNRSGQRARFFQVKIDLGIPGRAPVVVSQDSSGGHADLLVALREAFDAAERQLTSISERISHPARQERGRRKPRSDENVA